MTMTYLLARARFILAATLVGCFVAMSAPAFAQQQDTPVDPEARVMNEQMLLQQGPRIEGQINQLAQRERVLIQPAGRTWDYFHQVLLRWIGAIAIIGTLAALAAAYFFLGRLRIAAGRSGRKILRFKAFERFSHWLTAVSFVVLGLTGLNITFGKILLLPLIRPEAFADVAQAAKYVHNFTSFSFVAGLVLISVIFFKDNFLAKVDIDWLKQGGGFIRNKHAPAGRFNLGEKLVFWLSLVAGVAVSASGFLLLFPFYGTDIPEMQLAQVVHAVVAVLFIALILAHIYIGTLGMEGAFEAMGTGEVDLNWAKEHHDLWVAQQLVNEGRSGQPSATPAE